MWIWNLLFLVVVPGAFLFGLAEILLIQARNRGRSAAAWVMLGCFGSVLGGFVGFLVSPFVVQALNPDPIKVERVFFLSIGVPAVAVAALVGGLLKVLPPVAKTSGSFAGSAISSKAEEWHTKEQCKGCGFLFEVGEVMCQCPNCAAFFHVRCWNESGGCGVCISQTGGGVSWQFK